MKINILDLIDFDKVNTLLEGFNKTTGFVTAILDLNGKVLSKSGWRQICTEFHRINPETSKKCTISDTTLAEKLAEGEKYHFYQCLNGLVDVAVPIVINGEHIANLFSGQFFFEEPDRIFFKKQAKKYGFDEAKYLKALEIVPVISKEKVLVVMDFLQTMTQLISDTTFQKLKQMELNKTVRESEEKFSLAFITSPDSVNINRLEDGMYIDINESFTQITGYTREETMGKTSDEINIWTNPEDRARLVAGLKESGKVENLEAKFKLKNGQIIDGIMSASVITINTTPHILSITRDITEQKLAEKALRESEMKYRSFFENSMDAIFLTGPDGKIYSANPAACQMFGCTENEIIQLGIGRLIDPLDPLLPVLLSRRAENGKVSGELTMLRKDNTPIEVELSSAIFKNADNQQLTSMIIRDITERKKAEEKIKKLNAELENKVKLRTAQLEASNKELETFTYSVSHDLKAPLRGIDGYSKLLLDLHKPILNEEAQTFVERIRSSTLQMNQLIDDLLEYSRLERSLSHLKHVKIRDLIKSVLSIYAVDLETDNFNITMNIADIEIIADPKGLTIALRNLVENALKFSRAKANPIIQIEVIENDLSWIISVNDNGIGFNMQYHQKIFEIFQRLQRAEEYPGTGIGLAMVSKAMQRMHGRVWAESTLGIGSTFYLEIPKNQ